MADRQEFSGEIVVASRIVDYLSSGLYESPSASLKELINNSFDANASKVDVYVKPDANRIIIADDGDGMTSAEFVRNFTRISESFKRDEGDVTALGRPKIGKIGIGYISANEVCDVMEIASTKRGSPELLEVSINFGIMRQELGARRRDGDDIAKGHYVGTVREAEPEEHYTRIFLKEIRGEAKDILVGAGTTRFSAGDKSLYGLRPESVAARLRSSSLESWSEFDAYSKSRLEVALNVPVSYHDNWLPEGLRTEVSDIEREVAALDFSVFFDGSELRKPIVFAPPNGAFISRFEFSGEHVSATGYFYVQHGTIKPRDLQGLLIRIRNAAVGNYDQNFLGFSPSRGALFQNWISGEIMADDRLEEAMNIDRRTFRVTHPAYVELQIALHEYFETLLKEARERLYGTGREKRKAERASVTSDKIIKIAESEVKDIAPAAARRLRAAWREVEAQPPRQSRLLRKYSVDELYQMVFEVAREILSPEQFDEFVTRLTERLTK